MTDNVVKLYPRNAAENADTVLEWAQGEFRDILIIGWDREGDFRALASSRFADGGEVLWLLEALKAKLLAGELSGGGE